MIREVSGEIGLYGGLPVIQSPLVSPGAILLVEDVPGQQYLMMARTDYDRFIQVENVSPDDYHVGIYAVGLLRDIKDLRNSWKLAPNIRWKFVRNRLRFVWRSFREFRKSYYNGYMCELTPWPEDVKRCGTGWTKQRAIKSMIKQVDKANINY